VRRSTRRTWCSEFVGVGLALLSIVMAGLVPAIHVLFVFARRGVELSG
jgi:hypothetical protein